MMLGYLGEDNQGNYYPIGDNPPRKWLLNHLGRQHASKIYRDEKDGNARHVGYIIAGLWIEIFEVHGWNEGATQ